MKVRFQADADFNHINRRALVRREPAVDFQTVPAAELEGLEDPEVLVIAAQEDRVLVSHDVKTMPRHFADFVGHSQRPGVIIVLSERERAVAPKGYSLRKLSDLSGRYTDFLVSHNETN
ncbi:MAG: DUF5615 family PIN-like protein [Salinibacter sp.]|uniref:DUF5615 family PIN-like protein n=1 Tax=Salinibacter sp. TaxID=2065818 RepID=UPI0035D48CD7